MYIIFCFVYRVHREQIAYFMVLGQLRDMSVNRSNENTLPLRVLNLRYAQGTVRQGRPNSAWRVFGCRKVQILRASSGHALITRLCPGIRSF